MMWLLWLSIVGVAVAWAAVLIVGHGDGNEYLGDRQYPDDDENALESALGGALEGDLTRYVAQQNEAGR